MTRRYNLGNIRALFIYGFTEEELRDLCFIEPDFRPVYNELSNSASKNDIIRRLIEYAEQKILLEWKHNEKKRLAGVQLGGLDETYEALGEMAANMAERRALTMREAKKFVNSGIYWILDLGILLQRKGWVLFYTSLSKTYFAAFYLTVLLESNPSELSNLIRGSPNFWEKCLSLVRDLTYVTDVTPLTQSINTLKGGQTHV